MFCLYENKNGFTACLASDFEQGELTRPKQASTKWAGLNLVGRVLIQLTLGCGSTKIEEPKVLCQLSWSARHTASRSEKPCAWKLMLHTVVSYGFLVLLCKSMTSLCIPASFPFDAAHQHHSYVGQLFLKSFTHFWLCCGSQWTKNRFITIIFYFIF